ncbi:unnamed protein product [Polarella glacialis]|uniref:Tc1-like transposase DDE domain-containing protein n=1 Tax=Polarella glacialis TaxID=89957 RepID=A0A813FS15_POLGL|nr:unnamed protein product [Polarella glacialis]
MCKNSGLIAITLGMEEWAAAVESGKLVSAIKALAPVRPQGPWRVLCDNEAFLRAPRSTEAHKQAKVVLWKIPPRSPDLNPIEKYWAWLRKQLRHKDLEGLEAQRPVLGKMAFRARVRAICRTQRSQRVAAACADGLKKVCREVIKKRGAMARS